MPRTESSRAADPVPETDPSARPEAPPDPLQRFLEVAEATGRATRLEDGRFRTGSGVPLDPGTIQADFPGVLEATRAFRSLLGEARTGGSVLRARLTPRIDAEAARRILGGKGRPKKGEIHLLVLAFLATVRSWGEKQRLLVLGAELPGGPVREDLSDLVRLLPGLESEPFRPPAEVSEAMPGMLEALAILAETRSDGLVTETRSEVAAERARRQGQVQEYFAGLEAEHRREERRLAYHLYYFDRAERLEKNRQAAERERKILLAGEERLYRIESRLEPVATALLAVPTWVQGDRSVDAVTGEVR